MLSMPMAHFPYLSVNLLQFLARFGHNVSAHAKRDILKSV